MPIERVLSCIQPTGEIHFGNYFGAIHNWVQLQQQYDCFFGIVNYHAITMPYKPDQLSKDTTNMIFDLLACGISLDRSHLFIQSLIPEHTELSWILSCYCSYGELQRMTQFKDKSESDKLQEKGTIVSAGLFTYPILQAADILMYHPAYVPVGKDQEQHLELARNIAQRFNHKHGTYFTDPNPLFTDVPKLLSLADPAKKMSKSLGDNHVIRVFEEEASIRKKVKVAVTDTGTQTSTTMSAGVSNLFEILKACEETEVYSTLFKNYQDGNLKYSVLKEEVANALVSKANYFIKRRKEIRDDHNTWLKKVQESSEQTRAVAQSTLTKVKELVGLI
ncbi:MAG: tryptophan--tRNA ligase [Phycisphaerales bacterium]|nr:tryptophan--tRNA ligase [Phycisphaerales bacterium]